MQTFRNLSIRKKLAIINTGVNALALLLAGGGFFAYELVTSRSTMSKDLLTLAEMVGTHIAPTLALADRKDAQVTLSMLSVNEHILAAVLYDSAGQPFASYARPGVNALAEAPLRAPGLYFDQGDFDLAREVLVDGKRIGSLSLCSDMHVLYARLELYAAMVAGMLLISTALAFFLSARLQRVISRPISHLAAIARRVATRDYSVRAVKESDDELGALIDGFNEMMGQIAERDQALQEGHDQLEDRVHERTRELTHEISWRKRTEEDLAKACDAALDSSRLKSEFLANMSHEIRTPMNAILGMTGILLDTELTAEQREFAETVHSSGDILLTILNDILDFSKIESGKLTMEVIDFELSDVVDGVIDLLAERAAKKQFELAAFVAPDVPNHLRGDPGRLRQVLVNLLANGIKFTDRGEVILTIVKESETDEEVVLHCAVRDTGIGISEEAQRRLFQPFMQADGSTTRKYGGTGLGLAICKVLVHMMGGTIGVQGAPRQGSTFWFTVRLEKQIAPQVAESPPAHPLEGIRLLIVDDNETNRNILHHQAAKWRARADRAVSGREGLSMLRHAQAAGDPYRIAVIDMHMPEMDGLMLAEAIKSDPAIAATALVMLTSLVNRDTETIRAAGVAVQLSKPVKESQLLSCLVRAMRTDGEGGELDARTAPAPQRTGGEGIVGRVLVVEDNAVNQRVAVLMLRGLGCRADVAANGLEALAALERRAYGLVFMDCQMPEMDGYQATREIRRREGDTRHTSIVAMTAHALEGEREKCLEAGMDDYLSKPIKKQGVADVLARWIASPAAGESAAAPPEQALDPTALESLRGSDADPSGVLDIVHVYLEETPSLLSQLGEAVDARDAGAASRTAHALTGSSDQVGAAGFASRCREIEGFAGSGEWDAIEGSLEQLNDQFEPLREEMQALSRRIRAEAAPHGL
ncbi:MAG: hypothetical protein QOD06_2084 [Candidatus Binatota bacterium]|nr:hypothetical protein [Candidatus Binatota bacterium]